MSSEKKSVRILVLDDDNHRHLSFQKWFDMHDSLAVVHVTTVRAAKDALTHGEVFDVVFLDHDLNDFDYASVENMGYGNVELTGFEVARYIAKDLEEARRPKIAVVHSWNPPGANMMCEVLRDAGIKVRRWFFNPTDDPLKVNGVSIP